MDEIIRREEIFKMVERENLLIGINQFKDEEDEEEDEEEDKSNDDAIHSPARKKQKTDKDAKKR